MILTNLPIPAALMRQLNEYLVLPADPDQSSMNEGRQQNRVILGARNLAHINSHATQRATQNLTRLPTLTVQSSLFPTNWFHLLLTSKVHDRGPLLSGLECRQTFTMNVIARHACAGPGTADFAQC